MHFNVTKFGGRCVSDRQFPDYRNSVLIECEIDVCGHRASNPNDGIMELISFTKLWPISLNHFLSLPMCFPKSDYL